MIYPEIRISGDNDAMDVYYFSVFTMTCVELNTYSGLKSHYLFCYT